MFWIFTAILFVIAVGFVLLPLWVRNRAESFVEDASRKNENIALFQERSDELENELASGNLDQAEFDVLIQEMQQSLLSDVSDEELPTKGKTKQEKKTATKSPAYNLSIPLLLCLLMPLVAYGLYSEWGFKNDVELMGLFQRTVNNQDNPQESQDLIISLGEVVQADDDRPWAWYFLAENFASIGMFNEAEIAYTQSAGRMEETPEKALVLGRVAMAKYILAEFTFTADILEVIDEARAINPNEISILQLIAADAEEREDFETAIEYWRLIIQSNPNSEQAQILRRSIAIAQQRLAGDGQDVAAGPTIEIDLSLAEGLELDGNLRVFVAVRNAAQEGLPPLAAIDLTVSDLPANIQLDNSYAVGPFNISSADTIFVSASVSFSGSATPSSGDYRSQTDNFSHNGKRAVISLEIVDRVP
ncbi:MAG: c-type cytochrome biogenesis protein CcmI [SAR86 cluster bacterium]|uniref:C-type cytochrome biogenesis protein CcmI n=1 Tax=SAR86 cluster bacterium TaxID=2030880 RepID=A0A2A4XCQ5_9GAMM|nr:MAG: c-type cytochrome biogenesis protein CcmI [SAR86 cluster bacterium]